MYPIFIDILKRLNVRRFVLNKNLINKVDGESHLDITDFLEKELGSGRVNAFPIHEYWLDIGRLSEYRRATKDVELRSDSS